MKFPSSYDVIGNIAILPENTPSSKSIANKLLKTFKHLTTIAIKTHNHSGKYRLQKTKILAGKRSKTTLHKEFGCIFKLNIDKTYFSPRLSSERTRIANLIKKNESVLVMFSGVAIYPIIISKHSQAKEIYAIEINPSAHTYASENIELNKTKNIKLYLGDAKTIVPKLRKKFNRIIMPLPGDASSFLNMAISNLKPKGTIHMYDFQHSGEEKKSIEKIKAYCNPKILNIQKVGQYSPRKYRLCVDFKLKN